MKILMCNSFHYLRGGAERCFFGLMELLTAHGHEVIPFSMQHPRNSPSPYADYFLSHIDFPAELAKSGLRPKLRVAERVIYSREARAKIRELIAATRPDIAHVHGIAHETSPSILPAIKEAGIPIVQTLHDYKLLCPATNFVSNGEVCERCRGGRFYNAARYRCKRGSLPASLLAATELYVHKLLQIYEKHVDLFITPSDFLGRKLSEYGVRNPIVSLPNFVDLEQFKPSDEAPENYYVFYGRLVPIKGVKTLLEAARHLTGSRLYIIGEGEIEADLRAYVAEHGMQHVTFLGHLEVDRLVPLVQKAAFTVVPSESYENYSMTVIESLACGAPVIGARIGGIPEQVEDGWNGLLFEPGNARDLGAKIRYFLENPQAALPMRANARRRVEALNAPEYHYQQTVALYERVLGAARLS